MKKEDIIRYIQCFPEDDIESFYLEDKKTNKFIKLVYYTYESSKTERQVKK
jgi:hypothetical protein